jgi:hypothetical protein
MRNEPCGGREVDMTPVAHDERGTAAQVLALLQVEDLETLRARSKMLSFKQSADLLIPVIVALASADDGNAQLDLQPAVGVALYQSLVREPLVGPSVDAAIAQVMSGEHEKPRELDKSIPRALEAIILRATRARPEERFPSLRHLGAALLPLASKEVRQSYGADFPTQGSHVEAMLRGLKQGDALKLLAAALAIALPIVLAARQSQGRAAPSAETGASSSASEPSAPREPTPAALAATARAQDEPAQNAEVERPVPDRATANAAPATPADSATVPSKYPVDVAVEPSTAWIMLDDKAAGRGRLRRELPRDGRAHALHVGAPGYRVQALHFTDAPPPTSVVLAKRAR